MNKGPYLRVLDSFILKITNEISAFKFVFENGQQFKEKATLPTPLKIN